MKITWYLKEYFTAASSWLRVRKSVLDNLNVFPVPDGDTGSNMLSTVESVQSSFTAEATDFNMLCTTIIEKSLWGARGNSGVILANFLKGFFNVLRKTDGKNITAEDIILALEKGRDNTYKSIDTPVEGTILTIISETYKKAKDLLKRKGISPIEFFSQIYDHDLIILEQTPELLDVLKLAGVVDAGACGFFYIIEGILRYLEGRDVDSAAKDEGYIPDVGIDSEAWQADPEAKFCLEITLKPSGRSESIINSLKKFGTSEVAIDTGDLMKIHLHTNSPEPAIKCAEQFAEVLDIYKENMITQQYRMLADRRFAMDGFPVVAAIVSGSGMREIFKELGVFSIIDGGNTMNPSVEEIARGILNTGKAHVILLPNNIDIFLSAKEAVNLTDNTVEILKTSSMPEGVACLMNFSAAYSFGDNIKAMQEALLTARCGFITRSDRDTPAVTKGEYFSGRDKDIFTSGSLKDAVEGITGKYLDKNSTVVSIFSGKDTKETEIDEIRAVYAEQFPEVEVDVMYGGQPHYLFLLSID